MKLPITGVSFSSGISAKSKKPYTICNLDLLSQKRPWKTDMGEGLTNGYETNERNQLKFDETNESLRLALLALDFSVFPHVLLLDLDLSPDPEDPMKNIVTGFKPARLAV